jgi:hypothetical protein
MGVVDNYLIIYENDVNFMPLGIDSITPVFTPSDEGIENGRKWYLKIYRIFKFYENVLRFFVSGEDAVYLENVSDEEIIFSVTKLLKKMFKDKNVPQPKQIMRSKWFLDPYIRGSYSYIPVGCSTKYICDLAEPIYMDDSVSF